MIERRENKSFNGIEEERRELFVQKSEVPSNSKDQLYYDEQIQAAT